MKVKLICLPFAGGGKYAYTKYQNEHASNIVIITPELPGRGIRFREPLTYDIHQLVDDIYNQLQDEMTGAYAIYGHSMGSILAYLLALKISSGHADQPRALIVSGRGGPSSARKTTARHLLPRDEFMNTLKQFGGMPDEILQSDDFMNFFEPIIRADFRASENYQHRSAPALDLPLFVMIGANEGIAEEDIMAWQKESTQPIEVMTFPGKHFFIFDHPSAIMREIARRIV